MKLLDEINSVIYMRIFLRSVGSPTLDFLTEKGQNTIKKKKFPSTPISKIIFPGNFT